MITCILHITVKPGTEDKFTKTAEYLTGITRDEDDGCINYTFHRQRGEPGNFVLYEQWRDQDALNAHLAHLEELMGPAASRPDNTESWSPLLHNVVA